MLDVYGEGFDTLCEVALVPKYFSDVGLSHIEAKAFLLDVRYLIFAPHIPQSLLPERCRVLACVRVLLGPSLLA